MLERIRGVLVSVLGVGLCVFTLFEANNAGRLLELDWYPQLEETSKAAIFVMLGMVLCFLIYPWHRRVKDNKALRVVDLFLAAGTVVCCGYIVVQWQPAFQDLWLGGRSLGDRAGEPYTLDYAIGLVGVILVLEATRRSIGWAVPLLAALAIIYAYFRADMPAWLFPFRSLTAGDIVSSTFLKGQGVFGKASGVMFRYVFLFVVFGAFLEVTGATQFIIDFSERLFGRTPGGPAKVSVLGSGLMGSLSGSAVANAVTTGAFTIPMMRSAGFAPHIAGGITAAAASGGALVPPVMGAGAYMMLEFIDGVTFLEIAEAAVIPAVLYYLSIFMIVHFYARLTGSAAKPAPASEGDSLTRLLLRFESLVFFGALSTLVFFLAIGKSPFLSVTISLGVILLLWVVHPRQKISWTIARTALVKSAQNGIPLVSASACVGIIIGIVDATRVADAFGAEIKAVVESSLFLALLGVMLCSIVLGMGVPSVVCYLLMATMMGSLLTQLQVPELAAHLFIFYFGMMSMVTPPVALAAYASASIAESSIMPTAFAAFRFSLVGFTLPFMFIYRPALLLMAPEGETLALSSVALAVGAATIGIIAFAAGIAGYFKSPLSVPGRAVMVVAAALLLSPDVSIGTYNAGILANICGGLLFAGAGLVNWRFARPRRSGNEPPASLEAARGDAAGAETEGPREERKGAG